MGAGRYRQLFIAGGRSNQIILILPGLLTLLPVSLFADIGMRALLAYTVATVFLVLLPLALAGGDMIRLGGRKITATRTWVYGGLSKTDLSAAETWRAQCDGDTEAVAMGRMYILVAQWK